jgi:hypothetical protein
MGLSLEMAAVVRRYDDSTEIARCLDRLSLHMNDYRLYFHFRLYRCTDPWPGLKGLDKFGLKRLL